MSVSLTGSFYQVNNYFRLLSQTDRIITIEDLSLTRGKTRNDEILLNAKFVAVTFRQKDRPPDTTIEEEPETPIPPNKPPGAPGAAPSGAPGAPGAPGAAGAAGAAAAPGGAAPPPAAPARAPTPPPGNTPVPPPAGFGAGGQQ